MGWPAWDNTNVWWVQGPAEVHLLLPGGKRVDHDFFKAQVRRKGGRVDDVLLYLAYESLDAAHDRAMGLLKEWRRDSRANVASLDGYRDYWRKRPNVFEDPKEDWSLNETENGTTFSH